MRVIWNPPATVGQGSTPPLEVIMAFTPYLVRSPAAAGGARVHLGHPLLDAYLEMVAGRARGNTVLAAAFDLKDRKSVV